MYRVPALLVESRNPVFLLPVLWHFTRHFGVHTPAVPRSRYTPRLVPQLLLVLQPHCHTVYARTRLAWALSVFVKAEAVFLHT
jgi:hypothetical protein